MPHAIFGSLNKCMPHAIFGSLNTCMPHALPIVAAGTKVDEAGSSHATLIRDEAGSSHACMQPDLPLATASRT